MLNWLFKRTPQLTFHCQIAQVAKIMPIVPARQIHHAWTRRAALQYAEQRKHPNFGTVRNTHTARCPGIFSLMRHGFVMRTWQDIMIETNGDGVSCNWTTPLDQKGLGKNVSDNVSFFDRSTLHDFMESWPQNALKTVVKIQTPWRAIVPKGFSLLEMPVVYQDDNRFTTLHGVFNSEHGPAPLNPQLLWHVPTGKTVIKAGTPIAQYFLVPRDSGDMNITTDSEASDIDVCMALTHNHFVTDYRAIKDFYSKENK